MFKCVSVLECRWFNFQASRMLPEWRQIFRTELNYPTDSERNRVRNIHFPFCKSVSKYIDIIYFYLFRHMDEEFFFFLVCPWAKFTKCWFVTEKPNRDTWVSRYYINHIGRWAFVFILIYGTIWIISSRNIRKPLRNFWQVLLRILDKRRDCPTDFD